jgi:hypothetical protein
MTEVLVVEGRERESALVDGVWYDDVMMGLLAHEFHPRAESSENGILRSTE